MDTLSVATMLDQAPPNEEIMRIDISTAARHVVIIAETPSKTLILKISYRRLLEIGKNFDIDFVRRTSGLPFAPPEPVPY